MPRLSEMPAPGPLTGLELTPVLQGAGLEGNRGLPILAYGHLPRGAVLALRRPMTADLSATTDADPGAGNVRWNHAAPDQATELYVSHETGDESDLDPVLAGLAVGGFVYLQGADPEQRGNWQKWQVVSVTAASGYAKLGVALQDSDGEFAAEDAIELTLQQPTPSPGVDRNVVTPVASSSGTITLDASLGDYFTTTLTEDTTLVVANVPQACTLSLSIIQDAGAARTLAWPASFRWPSGHTKEVSTALGARDRLVITTDDYGATWDCALGRGHAP